MTKVRVRTPLLIIHLSSQRCLYRYIKGVVLIVYLPAWCVLVGRDPVPAVKPHSVLVAVVPAVTLVGRRVRRCSSQCEWWPVIAPVEPSHRDQPNYGYVGDNISRQWRLSWHGWSWSVHCQRRLWGCGPCQSTGRANCRIVVFGVGPISWQGYCGCQTRWSLSLMVLAEAEVKRRAKASAKSLRQEDSREISTETSQTCASSA